MKLRLLMPAALLGVASSAQTFTVLHSFDSYIDGWRPEASLVVSGGTLYGTTSGGFGGSWGAVFKMNTDGSGYALLHTSSSSDWRQPNGLILSGNTLYGTTQYGDTGSGLGIGTVFRMDTDGSNYAVLKTFNGSDGSDPMAGLVLDGETLYGTTSQGGTWDGGTVFKVKTDGSAFAVLYSFTAFTSSNTNGAHPYAPVILNGSNLYGTTLDGGAGVGGTVFKVDTNGNGFTILHTFYHTNVDGAHPRGGSLVLNGDTLYGTTAYGGTWNGGTVFKVNTNGSGFALLQSFPTSPSGPYAGLTLSGNTLYGVAANDGNTTSGMIFRLDTDGGGFTTLYHFSPDADGGLPIGGLFLSGGALYGTAAIRGPLGHGTVFKLQLPAPPPPPLISQVSQINGAFAFAWSANPGSNYQVQYKADAASEEWSDLGEIIVATNETLSASDVIGSGAQRFYRVVLLVP